MRIATTLPATEVPEMPNNLNRNGSLDPAQIKAFIQGSIEGVMNPERAVPTLSEAEQLSLNKDTLFRYQIAFAQVKTGEGPNGSDLVVPASISTDFKSVVNNSKPASALCDLRDHIGTCVRTASTSSN